MKITQKENGQKRHVAMRIVVCTLIITAGWAGMKGLASLKEPPAEAKNEERAISVQTLTAKPLDYPVTITGYGQARALTEVTIAPEVSGRIVATHPTLKTGQIVPIGALLFRIDPADYTAGLQEAQAGVTQWQNTAARLKKQLAIDTQRLKTLQRSAALAKTEFERIRQLFELDQVGTRSGVDQAERTYNSATDLADQMAQAVSLYPLQIREAQSSLRSAQARLSVAETNFARCEVTAPFNARLKDVNLEIGQFVAPGQPVLTLADDTILEIQVPLDSRDARNWLQFETSPGDRPTSAWFAGLKPVTCTICWTEDKAGSAWTGVLNRVVKFDPQTRTLTVAVRISGEAAGAGGPRRLPLVEGMFCAVEIPGRTMAGVVRLPRQAVTYENKVYLASAARRLKTAGVTVVRSEGEYVYVGQGLQAGDTVIITRLIDPLENSLLEMAPAVDKESAS
ncbi:Efflux transporter, RND family, MFP subunit [Desulfosarcina cetonica]|uniref:efflux RND transporter periplasmic adaptor subunit n=1 Tax=Desulfosarcina cetonica TaxID=90730 RepID=UPI0006CFE6C5|nr:HlyD family efflux transporter periplasmic adaptor subunit [Desulfosarcina cetonica]VTR68984.1 Efflux transporter, RND family, MFP subunit [Desulfosarcina cetonica]